MRLVFTGRAVRSARKLWKPPHVPWRENSTVTAAAEDAQPSIVGLSKTGQSYSLRERIDLEPVDLHPKEEGNSKPTGQQEHQRNQTRHSPREKETLDPATNPLFSSPLYRPDGITNLSPGILKLLDRGLYTQPNHPICITRKLIESVFNAPTYQHHIASSPVVSTAMNFDALDFPADHPGRSATDTYYVNQSHVLRTHTSAHQALAFKYMDLPSASPGYTVCADVFRRDSIDRSHFPVFHQMEGARLWQLPQRDADGTRLSAFHSSRRRIDTIKADLEALGTTQVSADDPNPTFHTDRNPKQSVHETQEVRLMAAHLKRSLQDMIWKVFQSADHLRSRSDMKANQLKVRWVEAYFPFTAPSWELEVLWQGDQWLELLGCGIVQQPLLRRAGIGDRIGWAWGIGIERLAMLLFDIPDIRLFWSTDERFLSQFHHGQINQFKPFSKYPECSKDVAFWIPDTPSAAAAAAGGGDHQPPPSSSPLSSLPPPPPPFHENDLMQLIRDIAGPLAQDVKLIDSFRHPTTHRRSLCYRIVYRSLERTLTHVEVNRLHATVCRRLQMEEAEAGLGLELR